MTPAEPPAQPPPEPASQPSRLRDSLAARVSGDGDGATDGAPDAPPPAEAAPERYNLAARIFGNGSPAVAAPPRPADGSGNAAAPAAPAVPPGAQTAVAVGTPGGAPPSRGGLLGLKTWDSLREVPAYRWYLFASFGSFGAMNMQMVVRAVLVFQLTGSYAALGVMSLANAVPNLLLSLYGGVIADRLPKKYVIQVGQTVSAMVGLGVGLMLYFDVLVFWHLIVSSMLQGAVFALMMPSRQSMTIDIVGESRLMNAVALNMSGMNAMRLFMPAAGGILFAAVGPAYVYFVMTAFYFFSVVTLSKIPARPVAPPPSARALADQQAAGPGMGGRPGMRGGRGMGGGGGGPGGPRGGPGGLSDIFAGFRYIAGNRTIFVLLAVNFFFVLMSMPYMIMLPGFVLDVLGGGPAMVGTLQSVAGIGSLAGTLVIASLPSRGRGKLWILGGLVMGVSLLAFSLSTTVWITGGIMIAIGIGQSLRMSLGNVLVQSYVDDEFRGRVMSINMLEMSMVSFGAAGAGLLAATIGPQLTLGGLAVALVLFSVGLFLFVPRVRNLD